MLCFIVDNMKISKQRHCQRHERILNSDRPFRCPTCDCYLKRHKTNCNCNQPFSCFQCDWIFEETLNNPTTVIGCFNCTYRCREETQNNPHGEFFSEKPFSCPQGGNKCTRLKVLKMYWTWNCKTLIITTKSDCKVVESTIKHDSCVWPVTRDSIWQLDLKWKDINYHRKVRLQSSFKSKGKQDSCVWPVTRDSIWHLDLKVQDMNITTKSDCKVVLNQRANRIHLCGLWQEIQFDIWT